MPSSSFDPVEATRFLALYHHGLYRCGICGGPMSHKFIADAGHLPCVGRAFRSLANGMLDVAKSFSMLSTACDKVPYATQEAQRAK